MTTVIYRKTHKTRKKFGARTGKRRKTASVIRRLKFRIRRRRRARRVTGINRHRIRNLPAVADQRVPVGESVVDQSSDRETTEPQSSAGKQEDRDTTSEVERYEKVYRQGYFDGGEARVGNLLPPNVILPELSLDDLVLRGLQGTESLMIPILTTTAVYSEIQEALHAGKPLSLVRLGDGELLTLAHDTVWPVAEVKRWGNFLPYAGVRIPDANAREMLIGAVCHADLIGVPQSRHPAYQGLLMPVLRHYGMDIRKMRLTFSTVNYALNDEGFLSRLLVGRKVLLIGNEADSLSIYMRHRGIEVTGVISPVQGVNDVPRVMEQVRSTDFDLALVAAGIAAVILCSRIARECGKVALDLGHLANKLVNGEAAYRSLEV